MHLFEHPEYGFYAAKSLEAARGQLVKDCGGEDDAESALMVPVPDERTIKVYGADESGETCCQRTARDWAILASATGYVFGGQE